MSHQRIALSVVVLFFVSMTLSAQDFQRRLSPAEKQHLLDIPFTVVTKTDEMPSSVKQAFAKITGKPSFALANPGEKFQVTDVIVDRTLPRRRLVFAGVLGNEWFVHYELGGRGHSYCLLLFTVDPTNGLQFLWGGSGFHPAKTLDQLRKMVAADEFLDDAQYAW